MSEIDAFIVRGHNKIIDHYRWLRDTAQSEAERERFQRCMDAEEERLKRLTGQGWDDRRAA